MKKLLMGNVGKFVALLMLLGVVLVIVLQVTENTHWRREETYDRLEERVAYQEVECGRDAKDCGEREQNTVKRWKRRKAKLGKKLGYE